MKKVLAMLLALVMVLSLSTVALASDTIAGGTQGNTSGDIIVNVQGGEIATVYSIIVEWTNLVFTYQQGDAYWNDEEGVYEYGEGWWDRDSGNTGSVTVTNKSNTEINVSAAIINERGNFKATLENAQFTLASYDQVATADSDTITIIVELNAAEGDLSESQSGPIGTVQLNIS